jgi:hypothetical protein
MCTIVHYLLAFAVCSFHLFPCLLQREFALQPYQCLAALEPIALLFLLRVHIFMRSFYWVTGWTIGVLRFDSQRGMGIFLFTAVSRTALGPTQPPIQLVPGALSLGVKRPGHEPGQSPPSSAEVKEWVELYLHSPNTPPWRGAQLKHRDNFTFTFILSRWTERLIWRYLTPVRMSSPKLAGGFWCSLLWEIEMTNWITNLLTPWNRVLLEKLIVTQLVKKFTAFYKTRRFITVFLGPYPEPDEPSPHLPTLFSRIRSNIILPSTPTSSEWSLPFGFSDQDFVCIVHLPVRTTRPAHLIFINTRVISVICLVSGLGFRVSCCNATCRSSEALH